VIVLYVATLRTTVDALDFIESKKLTLILAVSTSRIWLESIIDMLPDRYHVTGENERFFSC
jgi:hypothetical protein